MTPEPTKDAALKQLLADTAELITARFKDRADGAHYLLGEATTLLLSPSGTLSPEELEKLELTLDNLEDVLEALGVDTWS